MLKTFITLCSIFILSSCNTDDEQGPVTPTTPGLEKHAVEAVLEGGYWQEKICFVTKTEWPDSGVEVTDDILDVPYYGSYYNIRLDKFHVDPKSGKLRSFDYSNKYTGNWYYQNKYSLIYPDQGHIRIQTYDELSSYFGAAFNIDLQVVSCAENEIILDGPIKSYIWQNWNLDNDTKMYLGIRVFWTRIANGSEIYEPSSPLD